MSATDPDASSRWPVLRLLRTGVSFWTMVLAFAAFTSIYLSGRILDSVWVASGSGLVLEDGATAVTAFAAGSQEYAAWQQRHESAGDEAALVGPFAALGRHEAACFSAAVRGVATGQILFRSVPALPAGMPEVLRDFGIAQMLRDTIQPSLLSGIVDGLAGIGWLLIRQPLYALLFVGISLAILSFFGLAICRFHAIRTTRNETAPIGDVFGFACEKWLAAFMAPLLPLILLVGVSAVLTVVGLIGAIPVLGEWFVALTYGLALLAGVALAFSALASVLGFPLMWPTIAVEGSDSFDAVQHAAGYLFQRPGLVGLYGLILTTFAAVAFLLARVVLMLVLKLTHVVTGWGVSAFGSVSSSAGEGIGKLDGMWLMPAWADLPLLPGGMPFYGAIDPTGSLAGSEGAAAVVLAFWVFCAVGVLSAFVLNLFFVGATELYILLRNQIDGVEFDFIFCESLDEDDLDGDEVAEEATAK